MLICIQCNHKNNENSKLCEKCGSDLYLNLKACAIAVSLYNKGLYAAQQRRLSEAVEIIKRSLYFDKFNIDARNLIGLLYYELGMIGDALKHWAISSSYGGKDNLANTYLNKIKNNVEELENMNNAVRLFNNGLLYMAHNNSELAEAQLKKALALNPNLVEAKNLLALIYAFNKDYTQASQMIDEVRIYDKGNPKAVGYRDGLGQNVTRVTQQTKIQLERTKHVSEKYRKKKTYVPPTDKPAGNFKNFPLSEAISLVVGAVCAVAVMYILVIPTIETSGVDELEKLNFTVLEMQEKHAAELTAKNDEIQQLLDKNKELENLNIEAADKTVILEKQQKLASAASLAAQNNFVDAAAAIMSLDTQGLNDVDMAQYNSLKETVYPQAATICYNEGRAQYNTQNFNNAKTYFELGLSYGMTEAYAGNSCYYLGQIAEANNDLPTAITYYDRTVNEFKNCNQYYNALRRLNAIPQ